MFAIAILTVLVAMAALIYALVRLGNPFRAPVELPHPVTAANVDQALQHISEAYRVDPAHQAHDEAEGPAPPLPEPRKRRGRPPGAKTSTPTHLVDPCSKPAAGKPEPLAVLANALKIEAQLIYQRGHHAGQAREVVILSALGTYGENGALHVQAIRCICNHVRGWRCFRLEFITELTDMQTGEIVPDVTAWLDDKLAALI